MPTENVIVIRTVNVFVSDTVYEKRVVRSQETGEASRGVKLWLARREGTKWKGERCRVRKGEGVSYEDLRTSQEPRD
ncbi:hypothetical protein TWF694_011835 [Orbilia ellipsospora]|uniref:Uncharacterized protein n=1 Tax=Orbilia ellipsospora TaxID=2528407 RepID=A0AAV9X6R0_9PEZI